MPADLAAVQADDALLDMIGGGEHIPSDADDELIRVLAEWRREVHAKPVRQLVDTTTAMAMIRAAARQPARRRNPVFGSVAAAAAVLVIAFSSVGLVAKSAQPGDHLWGVTQVLYKDYARSVETAATVRTELNEAKAALNQGNPARARAKLQHIQQQLPAVGEDQGRAELIVRQRQLEQTLNGPPDPGSVPFPGGPAFDPSTPARVGSEATTSGKSTGPSTSAGATTSPTNPVDPPRGTKSDVSSSQYPGSAGYPGLDRYPHPGPGSAGGGAAGEYGGYPGSGYRPGEGTTSSGSSADGRHGPGSSPSTSPSPSRSPAPGTRGSTTDTGESTTEGSTTGMRGSAAGGSTPGSAGASHPDYHSVCDRPGPRPYVCGR
jgi:Anti-sigma-D factor RsdA to sigma factor binding region